MCSVLLPFRVLLALAHEDETRCTAAKELVDHLHAYQQACRMLHLIISCYVVFVMDCLQVNTVDDTLYSSYDIVMRVTDLS